MPDEEKSLQPFIQIFQFIRDDSRSGRVLSTVRIGDVYMSRMVIEPGVVIGNFYHKETYIMLYVEYGSVLIGLEHIETKERKEIQFRPGEDVIHISPLVARSIKNVGLDEAVIVFFSNKKLRSEDKYEYTVF